MSLVTVSEKRGGRVYQRAFDHDEARRLRKLDPEEWTYQRLAEHFGVTDTAVGRVCNPAIAARMAAASREGHRRRKTPCEGGCGRRVWANGVRTGYCPECIVAFLAEGVVRDGELRCTGCGEWKPDAEFHRGPGRVRRYRRSRCIACESKERRERRQRAAAS